MSASIEPIRILHIIDSGGLYGAESMLLDLAAEQLSDGLQPLILSVGNKACGEKAIEAEARVRGIPCFPYRMRDGLNLSGAREIVRLAYERGMDVIHSHNYKSNILMGIVPARLREIPVVTTLHGWTAISGNSRFSRMGLYCYVDQKLLSRLDAVVVVNPQLLNNRSIKRLPRRKVHLIANGLRIVGETSAPPDDAISKTVFHFKSQDCIVLGAIGRLSHEKNVSAFVAALSMLAPRWPAMRALILGDGPEAASLAKQIASAKLGDKVLLVGYVANAGRYVQLFDALVISSLTEGLPMVLLEAMAASTPVISTDVGGIASALDGTGELVAPGDPAALATGIEIFFRNRARGIELARRSRARVVSDFSAGAMAAQYRDVYRSVLGR